MRRQSFTVALAAAALILSACGSGDDAGEVSSGGRPKLSWTAAAAPSTREATADASAAGASPEIALYPARQVEYRLAEGVEAPAKSATAYRLVADKVDRASVARLARAFDLDGDVTASREGSMSVRSGTAVLTVAAAGITSWSFARNPEGSVSSGVAVACAPDAKCPPPPPPPTVPGLPTAEEAETKARSLLDEAGIDLEEVVASATPENSTIRTVSFTPRIEGREVGGLVTAVGFGEHGRVEYANGFLGTFEEVGEYPLVGMAEAVERLRAGFGGGVRPMAEDLPADSGASSGATSGSTGSAGAGAGVDGREPAIAPTEPAPGQRPEPAPMPMPVPDSLPPEIVEITGARVVLQVAYPMCPGDPVYVVPAFAFEPERAGTVVAVVDEELTGDRGGDQRGKAAQPCPGVRPEPPMGKPEPAPEPAPQRPEEIPGSAPAGAPGSSGSSGPDG